MENRLKYYVFEVNLVDIDGSKLDEKIMFSVSNVRWETLEEEIRRGEFLMDIETIKKVHETFDRNEARSMAAEF